MAYKFLTNLPLYYMKWRDHNHTSGWIPHRVIHAAKDEDMLAEVETVGWLARDTKNHYVLLCSTGTDEANMTMNILKSAVIKKTRLRV